MEEIQMLENQIAGYESKLTDLRNQAYLFTEAKGLDKGIEKARAEIQNIESDIETVKETLAEKQTLKKDAMTGTMKELSRQMSKVLPEGTALFEINEDGLFVGWRFGKKTRPYASLSGGENVTFDAALSFALLGDSKEKIVVLEAAELDADNLIKILRHLAKIKNTQLILNSCHFPREGVEGWDKVVL